MQENGCGRRIARRSTAFKALAALSLAIFCIADFSAKAGNDAPLVRIPQDEAPHHDETEWWYFSGHLRGFDVSGKPHAYGCELVFFQFNFPNQPLPLYEGNLAVTDLTGGSFHYEQKIIAQPIPDEKNVFNLKISAWRMEGISGANSLAAEFSDGR
jgi:predicted secreted hydrolase